MSGEASWIYQMWLRIFYRLRQAWVRVSLWKRAVVMSIALCLLIQLAFAWSLWREAKVREQLAGKATFTLGYSPLPRSVEKSLSRFVSSERLQLLAPVEMVHIRFPDDDDLRFISRLTTIKRLNIGSGDLGATGLVNIGLLSQLEELELESDFVAAQSLAGLAGCTKLRSLKIFGRLAPAALDSLRHCLSLEKLRLSAVRVYSGESAELYDSITALHLKAVARIPNLKSLVIYSPGISGTDLDPLAGAQRLEELFAFQVHLPSRSLNELGRMPRLKLLSLECETASVVEPLQGFPSLSTLALQGVRISPQFLSGLGRLPHLDTLSLEQCWVNDSLPALAKNSKLKRLNLEATDANVDSVRQIGRLDSLEVLAVPGFQTPGEFQDLFPKLKTSRFNWKPAVTKDSWRRPAPIGGGGGGFF